jgi:putative resolvase
MDTNIYSPKRFGAMIGRTTQTLQRWDREGILPAKRSLTDRRYYTHDDYLKIIGQRAKGRVNVSYARVSSSNQKGDLHSQKMALEEFCVASGKVIRKSPGLKAGVSEGRAGALNPGPLSGGEPPRPEGRSF